MRMTRFAFLVSLVLAVPIAIYAAVERAVIFAFSLIPTFAAGPRLVFNGPALSLDAPGASLDSALLNSLRHEAGMRRLN